MPDIAADELIHAIGIATSRPERALNVPNQYRDVLQPARQDSMYVEPPLSIQEDLETLRTSQVVLISAQAAVGKSAFARYIAERLNATLWALETIRLGDGTFSGMLSGTLGFDGASQLTKGMAAGSAAMVMDSLDEAVLRSGGLPSLEAFVADIATFARACNSPAIVILGRVETMAFAKMLLEEQDVRVSTLTLEYFDRAGAERFIDKALDASKVHAHRQQRDQFEIRRDQLLQRLVEAVAGGPSDWEDSVVRSFAGYAPVLLAVAKTFEEQNALWPEPDSALGTEDEQLWGMIARLNNWILEREAGKYQTQLESYCLPGKESLAGDIYSPAAQVKLTLDPLEIGQNIQAPPCIDPARVDEFRHAIESFLSQHPFLNPDRYNQSVLERFSNAVFFEYSLALGLLEASEAQRRALIGEVRYPEYRPTALFSRFALHLGTTRAREIPSIMTPILFASLTAQRSSNAASMITVEQVENDDLLHVLVSVADEVRTVEFSSGQIVLAPDEAITIVGDVRDIAVDVPDGAVRLGDGDGLIIRDGVAIHASRIEIAARDVDVVLSEGNHVELSAHEVIDMAAGKQPRVHPRDGLRIRASTASFPWRDYVVGEPRHVRDSNIERALRELRSLILWFHRFGRSDTGLRRAYQQPINSALGKGRVSQRMFDYCNELGMIRSDGRDYILDLTAAGLEAGPVLQRDLTDKRLFTFLQNYELGLT